jgi:hypothetical protein
MAMPLEDAVIWSSGTFLNIDATEFAYPYRAHTSHIVYQETTPSMYPKCSCEMGMSNARVRFGALANTSVYLTCLGKGGTRSKTVVGGERAVLRGLL